MPSTKESIIHLADEFIRSRGYTAFSYADISKPLGIKNAAVHYHYPSKSDLAVALVEWHIDHFEWFKEKNESKSPDDQIKTFLNFYHSIHLSGKVCLIGAFSTDWNSINEDTQGLLRTFTNLVIDWLSEVLQKGLDTGAFNFANAPRAEALRVLTNIFAAAQLSRITDSQDFILVKESIIRELTK